MHAGGEAVLGGQPAEQAVELHALGAVQAVADLVLVRGADLAELGHEPAALVGQVQRVVTAVIRVAPPFDQPAFFQPVDQEH